MRTRIDVIGLQNIFTNGDHISVNVIVRRDKDETLTPSQIRQVNVYLVCESRLQVGSLSKASTVFKGKPVVASLKDDGGEFLTYTAKLIFPIHGSVSGPLLGSLGPQLGLGNKNKGIQWNIRGNISTKSDDVSEPVTSVELTERKVTFKPTAPLPSMLDLVDTEHLEEVCGSTIHVITTHATAGLPQVPLAAGIGLRLICEDTSKFYLERLRILLKESTTISIDKTCEELVPHRWLIGDVRLSSEGRFGHGRHRSGFKITEKTTDLDYLVENTRIDHAALNPSFVSHGIHHKYDLLVELTLGWVPPGSNGSFQTRKVVSISPVEVLPRISGAKYTPRRDSDANEEPLFDPAELTDTSDDDVFESDTESGSDSIRSVFTSAEVKLESDSIVHEVDVPRITLSSAP